MRSLDSHLSAALAARVGNFYFRAYYDKLAANPNPPPTNIYQAIEIKNLVYAKLSRLEIELRTRGSTDYTGHRAVRVERGVTVAGVDYGLKSNWYFLTSVDYDQTNQITIWKGHILGHNHYTTAGDIPVSTVIPNVFGLVDDYYLQPFLGGNRTLTPVFPSHIEWYQELQFFPDGRTLALTRASNFENLLRQKYAVLMFPADNDSVRFQSSKYNNKHNDLGDGGFDYLYLDRARVLESQQSSYAEPHSFFWRDENKTVHWLAGSSDIPHNFGFMPSTALPEAYVAGHSYYVATPPFLELCGGDFVLTNGGPVVETCDLTEIWDINHKPTWYQIITEAEFIGNTEGGAMPSTIVAAAPYTPLDVSNFDRLLDSNDNNIQAAIDSLDDHVHMGVDIALEDAGGYFPVDTVEDALQQLGASPGGGLTQEQVEDIVGAMVAGNTETGIAVDYDDAGAKLNFDAQTAGDARYAPITHASTHQAGGGDAIKLDDLAAPDANTDLNASTTKHGLLPQLDNNAAHYLDGTGGWTVPAGSGSDTGPDKTLMYPPGFQIANLTTVTVLATNNTYALYLGRALKANPTFTLVVRVTTLAAGITWAEVGIATGTPVANGSQSLTLRGYTNVAATFNATGIVKTVITTTNINQGDDVYVLVGSQATTPFQLRGGLADDIQSGYFSTSSATRPSTMSSPKTFTLAGATVIPPWVAVFQA